MTMSGPAIFFDGKSSVRHDVTVELAPATLRVHARDGTVLAEWGYDQLEHLSAPIHVLRLGKFGSPALARLEVHDPQLAAEIDERSVPVDRSGRSERRLRLKVVASILVAAVSLVLVAVFGVPKLADRLALVVPRSLERTLGEALDPQVRASLDKRNLGREFECGTRPGEEAGRAAFLKLMRELETAAGLPMPLKPAVMRSDQVNAAALAGGHIYVLHGLIEKAQGPAEVAGVIAHEIGHIAHRDSLRGILQGAGLSLLFGALLGDFIGGGAVVWAATNILETKYSRDKEAAADLYAVRLMNKIGADARALATFLERETGTHSGLKILLDHPEAKERAVKIRAAAGSAPARPLLEDTEWAALRRICRRR